MSLHTIEDVSYSSNQVKTHAILSDEGNHVSKQVSTKSIVVIAKVVSHNQNVSVMQRNAWYHSNPKIVTRGPCASIAKAKMYIRCALLPISISRAPFPLIQQNHGGQYGSHI